MSWSPEVIFSVWTGAEPSNEAEADALDEEKAGAIVMLNAASMDST